MRTFVLLVALWASVVIPTVSALSERVYSGSELNVDISLNVIHNFDVTNEISGEIGVGASLIVSDRCGNRAPALSLGQVTLSVSDVFPGMDLVGCAWHGGEFAYDVIEKLPNCLGTVSAVEQFVSDLCIGDACQTTCPLQLSSDLQTIQGDVGDCREIISQAAKALVDCSAALADDKGKTKFGIMASTSTQSQGGGVYHNNLTPIGKKMKSRMAWAYGMGAVAGVALIATVALFVHNRKLRRQLDGLQQNAVVYQEMNEA